MSFKSAQRQACGSVDKTRALAHSPIGDFKRDHGIIITCAQPIDSERLAEIINGFLQEISEWKDDPQSEYRPQKTPFTKGSPPA
jgi:hypothetical protein